MNCLQNRLRQHNSGFGSLSTTPTNLRSFSILGLIRGFDNNNDLMLFVEDKWKKERDRMIRNGIDDPHKLAKSGNSLIQNINRQVYQNFQSYLICLFQD